MAQFNKNEQDFLNQERTLFEVNMIANKNGQVVTVDNPFPVSIGDTTVAVSIGGTTIINTEVAAFPKSALSAFDELVVQPVTQLINTDSIYGLDEFIMSPENSLDGSTGIGTTDRLFYANSGIQTGGVGNLRTTRFAKYRPGIGINGRFTAMFDTPIANSRQNAGFSNAEGGYYFGYIGTSFGIGHTYDGLAHIVTLNLTTNPNATQVATINLAGVGYTVSISAGTTYTAAAQIANSFIGNAVWRADNIDNKVVFVSARALDYTSGTYSLTSTGNLAGTISTNRTGRIRTEVFTPQNQWNGVGLGTFFNPQNLNVYQINYRWLGAGVVRFTMEHPETGDMVVVHTQKWASRYQIPHVPNPSFRLGYSASATAALARPVVLKGASMGVSLEGQLTSAKPSQCFVINNGTTRAKDTEWHLFSLRNNWSQNYYSNTQEVQVENMSAAFQGADPVIVKIYISKRNVLSTIQRFSPVTGTYLTSDTDETQVVDPALLTTPPVVSFTVGINGSIEYDLRPYRIVLSPGQIMTVTFVSTQQITRSACTVTWNPE